MSYFQPFNTKGNAIMTAKQLLSTGILNILFKHLPNTKNQALWKHEIASYIARECNRLLLHRPLESQDQAKLYLESLRRDYKHLDRMQTHINIIQPLRETIRIKIAICEKYIELYRNKPSRAYHKDLFILILGNLLQPLKYVERMEIICDLFLLVNTEVTAYSQWKKRHPAYWLKTLSTIKKRFQRLPRKRLEKSSSYSIPYITAKDMHLSNALDNINYASTKSINKPSTRLKDNEIIITNGRLNKNDIIVTKIALQGRIMLANFSSKDVRARAYISHLKRCLTEHTFISIDAKKLLNIISNLKIPAPEKFCKSILSDKEFLNAFALPRL